MAPFAHTPDCIPRSVQCCPALRGILLVSQTVAPKEERIEREGSRREKEKATSAIVTFRQSMRDLGHGLSQRTGIRGGELGYARVAGLGYHEGVPWSQREDICRRHRSDLEGPSQQGAYLLGWRSPRRPRTRAWRVSRPR